MNFRKIILFLGLSKRTKREILLDKIKKEGFLNKEVFVSVDEFFDGNDDIGSIGCNIYPEPPTLQQFFSILSEIKSNSKTKSVLVRISDIEDTEWFYSDTIYLFGDYGLKEVKALFKKLKPDDVFEGMMYDKISNIPQDSLQEKSFSIWWD